MTAYAYCVSKTKRRFGFCSACLPNITSGLLLKMAPTSVSVSPRQKLSFMERPGLYVGIVLFVIYVSTLQTNFIQLGVAIKHSLASLTLSLIDIPCCGLPPTPA